MGEPTDWWERVKRGGEGDAKPLSGCSEASEPTKVCSAAMAVAALLQMLCGGLLTVPCRGKEAAAKPPTPCWRLGCCNPAVAAEGSGVIKFIAAAAAATASAVFNGTP